MTKRLRVQETLTCSRHSLEAAPRHRTGHDARYEIADGCVFGLLQSPSFRAYQQQMRQRQGQDNAKSLFGIEAIPSDGQIRNLLDPIDPGLLREPF